MKRQSNFRALVWVLAGLCFLNISAFGEDADPFLAPGESDGNLPAPSLGTPASLESTTPPVDSTTAAPPPSQPSEQAPIPLSSIPGKTADSPAAVAGPEKDIYEEYEDYLNREGDRATTEKQASQRTMFAHENGAWQFGLAYVFGVFSEYDFDPTATVKTAKTSGPTATLSFFPLRSLSFGRLGVGVQGGYYWSTFTLDRPEGGTLEDKVKGGSMSSYGARAIYEFEYIIGQTFVPFAFVSYDQIFVKKYVGIVRGQAVTGDFPSAKVNTMGYGGGLRINLNRIEPVVASRALAGVGVRKFYLTYAAVQRPGKMAGLSHSAGLDFEF